MNFFSTPFIVRLNFSFFNVIFLDFVIKTHYGFPLFFFYVVSSLFLSFSFFFSSFFYFLLLFPLFSPFPPFTFFLFFFSIFYFVSPFPPYSSYFLSFVFIPVCWAHSTPKCCYQQVEIACFAKLVEKYTKLKLNWLKQRTIWHKLETPYFLFPS